MAVVDDYVMNTIGVDDTKYMSIIGRPRLSMIQNILKMSHIFVVAIDIFKLLFDFWLNNCLRCL